MAFYVNTTIEPEEIARQMSNDLQDALDTLAALAAIYSDEGDADHCAEELVLAHSGSRYHDAVAPFLRRLADRLALVVDGVDTADAGGAD